MTRFGGRSVALAVVVAIAALAAGCARDPAASPKPPLRALQERIGRYLYVEHVATREWLVGSFHGDWNRLDEVPRLAVVPLRGGRARLVRLPLAGRRFAPTVMVSNDRHVVVFGLTCSGSMPDPPTEAARFCTGGTPAAFRFDPATRRAHELRLDPSLTSRPGLSLTTVQRTRDGWHLFGMRFLDQARAPGGNSPAEYVVVAATTRKARLLASVTDTATRPECTTADAAWAAGPSPVDGTLRRIAFDGTAPVDLPPPPAPAGERSPFVALAGCLPAGPVAVSAVTEELVPPATVPDVRLRAAQWVDGAWRDRPDLVPDRASALTLWRQSDVFGLLLPWNPVVVRYDLSGTDATEPSSTGTLRQRTVAAPVHGRARVLEGATGEWWWGSSGVRLGPRSARGRASGRHAEPFPGIYSVRIWD